MLCLKFPICKMKVTSAHLSYMIVEKANKIVSRKALTNIKHKILQQDVKWWYFHKYLSKFFSVLISQTHSLISLTLCYDWHPLHHMVLRSITFGLGKERQDFLNHKLDLLFLVSDQNCCSGCHLFQQFSQCHLGFCSEILVYQLVSWFWTFRPFPGFF